MGCWVVNYWCLGIKVTRTLGFAEVEFLHVSPIGKMCLLLGVSRSAYYAWRKRKPSNRSIEYQRITPQIRLIHQPSHQTYGSPRITEELQAQGEMISCPRVARLMKKANIRSKIKRKFVVTTDSNHTRPVAKNLLNRQLEVSSVSEDKSIYL